MASDAVVNLIINAADAEAEVNLQLRQIANQAERNAPPIVLNVTIDQRSITNNINQVNDGLNRINRNAGDAEGGTNRLGAAFTSMGRSALTGLASAGRLGLIASLASAALPAVVGLGAALANIAPAATAGVAAFATLKLATATLKVGLIGVSDAISQVFAATADPEALAEALKNLSPEARSFVLELQRMKPALDELRLDVQDRLFKGLDSSLANLGKATLPAVRTAALSFSGTFNEMARSAAKGATSLSQQGVVGQALKSSSGAFANLSKVPGQVLVSIVRLVNAGGPLLGRLTDRVADAATNISKKLATAQQSGGLKKAVDDAAKALAQLGRIASNVFGALGNIFSTASAAGGGLFGSLEKVTQALEDLTATTGFKDTLTALVQTGQVLLTTILPVLAQAFQAIGPVIQELALPVQRIIMLLGDELADIITVLAPILEQVALAFGNLLIALSPLIAAAGDLITAILPVLVPLFEAVNEIIVALTPIIALLATELVDALMPVIVALIPVITELAEFIAQVAVAIAPLVEELVPLIVDLFTDWAPVITGVLEALTPLLGKILDFVAFLVEQLVPAIIRVIDWVKQMGDRYRELVGDVIDKVLLPALRSVRDFLNGDYAAAWQGAKNVAVTAGLGIASSVRSTTDDVRRNFIKLSISLPQMIGDGLRKVEGLFSGGGIIRAAGRLVAMVVARISDANGALFRAGQQLMISLGEGILSKINDAVSAAASAVSKISKYFPHSPAQLGPFSGRGYPLYSGQAIMESLAEGITSRTGVVGAAMNSALSGSSFGMPSLSTGSVGGTQSANVLGSLAGGGFGRVAAPSVAVYLGNELLTDRMHKVVVDENSARDRQASQGVRF